MKERQVLHANLDTWAPAKGATHADLGMARAVLQDTVASGREFTASPFPQAQAVRPIILPPEGEPKPTVSPAKMAQVSSAPYATPLDFDRPDWARGLRASQRLGPFERYAGVQNYVNVYPQVNLVPVRRDRGGGQVDVLAYIPLLANVSAPMATEISLFAGTVQIAVAQLVPGQSPQLFAGTRVKSGKLKCASGLVLSSSGTLTVHSNAEVVLSLNLDQQAVPAGNAAVAQDAGDLTVNLPSSITITFTPNGGQVTTLADASLTAYNTTVIGQYQGGKPQFYHWWNITELQIPYNPSVKIFAFAQVKSKLLRPQGVQSIVDFAFSMPVAEAQGSSFGEMAQPGALFLGGYDEFPAQWLAMTETQRFQGVQLWFSPMTIGARLMTLRRKLNHTIYLWEDKNNASRRCEWLLQYDKGADLVYLASAGQMECLLFGVQSDVRADRPVTIAGSPIPIEAIPTLVMVIDDGAERQLAALGGIPTQPDSSVPEADYLRVSLENGVLTTGKPLALALGGVLSDWSIDKNGILCFVQPTVFLLMMLPDPYVINYNDPATLQGLFITGIIWATPATAQLLLGLESELLGGSKELARIKNRLLFDVSGLADQFGVQYRPDAGQDQQIFNGGLCLDRNALAAPGKFVDLTTLPSISWEPMVALPLPSPPVNPVYPEEYQLRVIRSGIAGDGDFDNVTVPSVALVRIAPEIVFQEYVAALGEEPAPDFMANLHLPFGLLACIDTAANQYKPRARVNQPKFPEHLTGGLQLKLLPFHPESPREVFDGYTDLIGKQFADKSLNYGQIVLGRSVAAIFDGEFGGSEKTRAVPVRRYDLSGYGASIYSDWRDPDLEHLNYPGPGVPNPDGVGVVKVAFEVCVGRTAYEEIIVQAVIHPWGIKVRRTVTMKRRTEGWVIRRDSGWVAISDSLFIPFDETRLHRGLIEKLVQVENIVEVEEPLLAALPMLQAVRFDAAAIINNKTGKPWVKSGAVKIGDREAVPCREVWGVLYLNPQPPDPNLPSAGNTEASGLAESLAKYFLVVDRSPARGKVACDIDVGGCGHILRATQIEALPVLNPDGDEGHLVLAMSGSPVLPRQGAWSVTRRTLTDASPQPLAEDYPVPVIQPNGNDLWHFSDPRDIFQLTSNGDPSWEYGFLQGTGTQKIYFPHPQLQKAPNNPNSSGVAGYLLLQKNNFQLADVRGLLRSTGLFSAAAEALQTDLTQGCPKMGPDGFSFTKDWTISPLKTEPLLETDAVKLELCYADATSAGDDIKNINPTRVHVEVNQNHWEITAGPISLEMHAWGCRLLAVSIAEITATNHSAPQMADPSVVLGQKLKLVSDLLNKIQEVANYLPSSSPSGLKVDFANGKLTIGQSVFIQSIPLGFGTVKDVLLDMGGSVSFLPPTVSFGLGLGSEETPMTLIITPFAGTALVRLAITESGANIVARAGIGVGIAINIAVASGYAAIVVAIQVEIGNVDAITVLLTGQAGVDVLGGIASASLTLEAAGDIQPLPDRVHLTASVSVGIHISICWIIDVDFDGSWPFGMDVNR